MLHIDIPTLPEFKALAATRSDACVSLYVPTSPLAEDTQANRIVFEDLAKEALSQLRAAGLDKRRTAPIAEQFGHLSGIIQENTDDNKFRFPQRDSSEEIDEFWASRSNSLALLATPEMKRTFRLPNRPRPLAEVADRFHLTPLIRAMTSPHDVFVLALSEERVRQPRVGVDRSEDRCERLGRGEDQRRLSPDQDAAHRLIHLARVFVKQDLLPFQILEMTPRSTYMDGRAPVRFFRIFRQLRNLDLNWRQAHKDMHDR